jgi:hypothetical protein
LQIKKAVIKKLLHKINKFKQLTDNRQNKKLYTSLAKNVEYTNTIIIFL